MKMRNRRKSNIGTLLTQRAALAAAVSVVPALYSASAHASNFTWTGAVGINWITASGTTNWNPSTGNPGSGDIADFGTPTATQPTLNQSAAVSGLLFTNTSGNWTLSGSGSNVLTVGANEITATAMVTGTLTFGLNLQESASEPWAFGNSTSTAYTTNFNGGIDLNDGTLAMKFIEATATGNTATVNITGPITSTGGGGNISFTGASSGHASITISGTSNTFSGNTTVTQATLTATSLNAFGTGATSTVQIGTNSSNAAVVYTGAQATSTQLFSFDDQSTPTLNSNGTGGLMITNAGNAVEAGGTGAATLTLGGTYASSSPANDNRFGELIANSGSGTTYLMKNGSSSTVWDITNTGNSFTGAVTVSTGTISVDNVADGGVDSELGAGTVIDLGITSSTGTLRYNGGGGSTNRSIAMIGTTGGGAINSSGTGALNLTNTGQLGDTTAGAKTFILNGTNTNNNTFALQIIDSTGGGTTSLSKTTSGTWILTNTNNTYSGKTTISGGILGIDADGSVNGGAGGIVFSGGTLQFQNYISNLNFANDASLSLGAATGAASTLSGSITGTSALTYAGPGTLTLGAANNYSGGTSINAGVLNFISLANLGSGPITFNGGTLQYAVGNTADISGVTVTLAAGGGTIDTNGNNVTFANSVGNNGSGGLTKSGAGTLTLSAANAYSGPTTVNVGTLNVGNSSGSATGTGNVTLNGGVLASGATGSISGNVIAGSGAHTIAPGGIGNVGSLYVGGLTTSSLTTINFDLGSGAGPEITSGDLLTLGSGTVNIGSGTNLTFGGTPVSGDDYRLIGDTSAGAVVGAIPLGNFALPAAPAGLMYELNASIDSGYIDLVVTNTGPATLTWNNAGGAAPSDGQTWDIGTNNNWNNGTATTVYTDGSNVVFSDSNNATSNGGTNPNAYNVTLNTVVSPGSVTVNNSAGNYTISGTGKIAGTTSLTKSGSGTLTLATANTYSGGTTVNAGLLEILPTGATSSALPAGPVTITGGTLQLATNVTAGSQSSPTPASNVNITSLAITGNGTLDINNNHIIINYGSGADPISSIAALISSGFNGGAWTGTGITSTAAQANSGSYGIGYADASDPGNPAGLASGQIEIMYTLLGDANLDGAVNGTDFAIMASNFNKADAVGHSGWDEGDFNYDGSVNGSDFAELAANFNKGASQAADLAALDSFAASNGLSLTANVPEPASVGVLVVSVVGALGSRKRRSVNA